MSEHILKEKLSEKSKSPVRLRNTESYLKSKVSL